jgi:hypothetical protein
VVDAQHSVIGARHPDVTYGDRRVTVGSLGCHG